MTRGKSADISAELLPSAWGLRDPQSFEEFNSLGSPLLPRSPTLFFMPLLLCLFSPSGHENYGSTIWIVCVHVNFWVSLSFLIAHRTEAFNS